MKYKAFGESLLITEIKNENEVGGIKVASVGLLKSGTLISMGGLVSCENNVTQSCLEVGDEVIYVADQAIPFEFGGPNIFIVNVDAIVAFASKKEVN